MSWESVEMRNINWCDLWAMEMIQIKFYCIIGATSYVPPTPQNFRQWVDKYDLKCLARAFESKHAEVSLMPVYSGNSFVGYVWDGQSIVLVDEIGLDIGNKHQ